MDRLRTSRAMQLEQVLYTFAFITDRYATSLRSKRRFRVEGGRLVAFSALNLHRPTDRSAHLIGCSTQGIVTTWAQLAASVRVCTTEELVQLFIVLRRPWARPEVLGDERKRFS